MQRKIARKLLDLINLDGTFQISIWNQLYIGISPPQKIKYMCAFLFACKYLFTVLFSKLDWQQREIDLGLANFKNPHCMLCRSVYRLRQHCHDLTLIL